jgi:hypothetical protein
MTTPSQATRKIFDVRDNSRGENVYADSYSRRVHEVPAGSITTPQRAAELLAPLLDETPLSEIIEGLRLFQGA